MHTVRRIWLLSQLLVVACALVAALRGAMRVADTLLIIGAIGQLVWLRWLRAPPAPQKTEQDVRTLQ